MLGSVTNFLLGSSHTVLTALRYLVFCIPKHIFLWLEKCLQVLLSPLCLVFSSPGYFSPTLGCVLWTHVRAGSMTQQHQLKELICLSRRRGNVISKCGATSGNLLVLQGRNLEGCVPTEGAKASISAAPVWSEGWSHTHPSLLP